MKKPLLVLVARRRRRSFIGSLIFKFLMQKSFKNKFSWPNHPLISCIAYVILLFVEFKLCRLCPLIVLTLSFSCVSFDFLLCEIQIVLTLAFCCVHFDFFNFCRLCPSIVLTLAFYCVDFKWHMWFWFGFWHHFALFQPSYWQTILSRQWLFTTGICHKPCRSLLNQTSQWWR